VIEQHHNLLVFEIVGGHHRGTKAGAEDVYVIVTVELVVDVSKADSTAVGGRNRFAAVSFGGAVAFGLLKETVVVFVFVVVLVVSSRQRSEAEAPQEFLFETGPPLSPVVAFQEFLLQLWRLEQFGILPMLLVLRPPPQGFGLTAILQRVGDGIILVVVVVVIIRAIIKVILILVALLFWLTVDVLIVLLLALVRYRKPSTGTEALKQ